MLTSSVMSKANLVKELLLKDIKGGKYLEGDRLPSDNELMRDLKVSRNTVREALSFLMTEGYVIRIQGKGTFATNHKPADKVVESRVVYIIARDEHGSEEENPFIGKLMFGAMNALENEAFGVRLRTFTPDEWCVSPESIETICSQNPVGVIFAGFFPNKNLIKQFHQRNVKCCSIGAPREGVDIPYVDVDHFNGVRIATEYLAQRGHKRIGFINFDIYGDPDNPKLRGFAQGLKNSGLEHSPECIVAARAMNIAAGRESITKLLESCDDISAIIVDGDYLTFGIYNELIARGMRIPEDISLIMHAGYRWVCKVAETEFSRVEQDHLELGRNAVGFLLDKNDYGEKKLMLNMNFIEGETCSQKVEDADEK